MSTTTEMFKEGVSAIGKALGISGTTDHLSKGSENANEAATMPKHAIAMLTIQHREVDQLFAEIENAGEAAHKTKEKLFEILARKLSIHTELEEKIFYPAATRADKKLILESYEEHDNVKTMLKKMANLRANDEHFEARLKVLKDLVHHHVREEEGQLFPKCEAVLGESTLEDLGHEMVQRMKRLEHQALRQPTRKAAKSSTRRHASKAAQKKKTGRRLAARPAARKTTARRSRQSPHGSAATRH